MFSKIRRKLSSIGMKKTAALIARRFYAAMFSSSGLFFKVDLLNYNTYGKPTNDQVEVIEIKSFESLADKDLRCLRDYGGNHLLAIFEKRLAKGHRLFLSYLNGQVAGASWVYIGGEGRFFIIPLSEKDFIIVAVFTIDRFRRMRIAAASLIAILDKMRLEGFHRGFISTKQWNFFQNAIAKAGFEFVGKFHRFRILKRSILIWSSVIDNDFI